MPDHATGPADLLAWYDRHRRTMPWRALPGEAADPYQVWLSEIMLQQTTVAAVIPYYQRFLARFPDVHTLATAPAETVMSAWAGLGYYARARNLHACAKAVAALGGQFPDTVEALLTLPGIGPYTARAVAAIAFGVPVVPVDGNVERIAARLFAIATPLPAAKPALAAAADRFGAHPASRARASDFAQALFDLGATICTRTPACGICPLAAICAARCAGNPENFPARTAKPARPTRHGALFWLTDSQNRVLLRRRPPKGLLGGMTELPGTDWLPAHAGPLAPRRPGAPCLHSFRAPSRSLHRPRSCHHGRGFPAKRPHPR
jgi:A/G-specific adenine glycosylase